MRRSARLVPDVLKIEDLCGLLNISRSTAYRLVREGVIPSIKIGRLVRISRSQIEKLLS